MPGVKGRGQAFGPSLSSPQARTPPECSPQNSSGLDSLRWGPRDEPQEGVGSARSLSDAALVFVSADS